MNSFKLALDGLGRHWPGFSKSARTVGTFRQGQQTQATRAAVKTDPEFLTLSNVPRVGGCQLLMYDTGGENFSRVENIIQFVDYTLHSQCIIWLIGLVNLVVLAPRSIRQCSAAKPAWTWRSDPPPARVPVDGRRQARIATNSGRKLDELLRITAPPCSPTRRLKKQSLVVVLARAIICADSRRVSGTGDISPQRRPRSGGRRLGPARRGLRQQENGSLGWAITTSSTTQYFSQFSSPSRRPTRTWSTATRALLALFWLWQLQRPAV